MCPAVKRHFRGGSPYFRTRRTGTYTEPLSPAHFVDDAIWPNSVQEIRFFFILYIYINLLNEFLNKQFGQHSVNINFLFLLLCHMSVRYISKFITTI